MTTGIRIYRKLDGKLLISVGCPLLTLEVQLALTPHFAHQGNNITFGVAELRQPKVMIRHAGNYMRLALYLCVAFDQAGVSSLNIGNLEIQDRGRVIELRTFRRCKHHPNAATIEEG